MAENNSYGNDIRPLYDRTRRPTCHNWRNCRLKDSNYGGETDMARFLHTMRQKH